MLALHNLAVESQMAPLYSVTVLLLELPFLKPIHEMVANVLGSVMSYLSRPLQEL